jgi:hypothetical protein
MRRRIDLNGLFELAVRQVMLLRYGGGSGRVPPAICPLTLDQLLTLPALDLEAAFTAAV